MKVRLHRPLPWFFRIVWDPRFVLVGIHSLLLLRWRFEFDSPWTLAFPILDLPAFMLYGALDGCLRRAGNSLTSSPMAADHVCFWVLGNLQWFGIGWIGLLWKRQVFPRMHDEIASDAVPCSKCGYDLRGNVSGVCPECGQRIT